jgi:glycerophosphoryl diester phosphodiesterase
MLATLTGGRRPAISAHRGGGETANAGTWEAFSTALDPALVALPEYVEFDVRRTRDGTWVVHHDEHAGPARRPVAELGYGELVAAAGYPVPRADDVMSLVAGRAIGHLDLKESTHEAEIVGTAVDIFGADGFVLTTETAASIRTVKSFAPFVCSALSLKGCFDLYDVFDSGADWVTVDHRIVTPRVLDLCRLHGLGVMVWTVNDDARIAHYLNDNRVRVLITDRPRYAASVRAEMVTDRTGRELVRASSAG